MAEFLWTFAVEELLKKVLKLAAEQIGLAWGLDKELSKLSKWLLKAQSILGDINAQNLHHESLRLWVEDLQHIVHEADDLLDELVYEDLRRKVETEKMKVRCFFLPSNDFFLFRVKMTKKMKDITETLYKHYCEASPLGLVGKEPMETATTLKQIRETTSNLNFEVVGREIEVSNIVKLVIDSSNEHSLSILPIVGMGGLGKTTLAKMIFNHEQIKAHFDETIWVCVSESFIIINILEGIFQSLTKTSSGLNYKETLLRRLQMEVQGKNYFLVLDDVWNEEVGLWHELRDCLKEITGKSGNSIIVTTRSAQVATIMKTLSSHHLRKLSDDQCWYVFKKSANINELPLNSELEIIREMLVKKIGGIPLVAKVLGGTIKFEEDYGIWVTKVESIIRNFSEDDNDFVLSILKLSVDSLPLLSLKQCFAYCSNFSKGEEIAKENLIQMWIAQGLIQPRDGDKVMIEEDIGEEYFNFLLSRSLFQDVSIDKYGRITHFKMHDLIHDIACTISNCQKLELSPSGDWSRERARKLRTLICNNQVIYNEHGDCVCLRVLVLDSLWSNKLPDSIGKLKHLRYLDISNFSKSELPESITMLYNLQTLKLGRIISLPKKLSKLVSLRHLQFSIHDLTMQMPSHMSQLIQLQTLSSFAVGFEDGCKIEELGPLKNLKGTLRLLNLNQIKSKKEAIAANLVERENICVLSFEWSSSKVNGEDINYNDLEVLEGLQPHKNLRSLSIINFRGKVFPNGVFVENLVEIRLHNCEKCEMLPMLGKLPNLEELDISFMDGVRNIGSEFYGNDFTKRKFFPKLKELELNWMHNLEQWEEVAVESNHFRSLQALKISECCKLRKLPNGLECCNSIEYLRIFSCPNLTLNVQNMHNLSVLIINKLPEGLDCLTNLKQMEITGCMSDYDFRPLIHLSSLTTLCLVDRLRSTDDLGGIQQLPQQLEYLTALKALTIKTFRGIEALPEWLGSLTSLETLNLVYCKNLKHLPSREAMVRLSKFNHLYVQGCPQLHLRQGDLERAKLSHLPRNCVDIRYSGMSN